MKKYTLAFVLFVTAFISCQEKDVTVSQNTKFLIAHPWRFDNAGVDIDKNGTIDTNLPASLLQPCLTDNTLTFANGGAGTVDEGAAKCNAAAPQTTAFTWSFAENETKLSLQGNVVAGTSSGQFNILALNETRLSLSRDTTVQGLPLALVINFKL